MNTIINGDYQDRYEKVRKIGASTFTEIWEARLRDKNEYRAIKIIKLDDIKLNLENSQTIGIEEYKKKIKNEINNMIICGTNNENSVKYYESFENEKEFSIVMEKCDMNLRTFVKKLRRINLFEIHEILCQLNNTFKIMNDNKIVHRDLKLDNILISYGKFSNIVSSKIKLCDYGISKIGYLSKLITPSVGTLLYMAPEIMELTDEEEENNSYNYKCDLWSLGIIIYEIMFGETPYKGTTEVAVYMNIQKLGKKSFKKTGIYQFDDLINKLLEKNPKDRLSWDEYFNHPFFKDFNCITLRYEYHFDGRVHIFNKKFEENNKNYCRIKYKNRFSELVDYILIFDDILEIQLIGYINDMSHMFHGCKALISISDLKSNYVKDMSYMFYDCEKINSLAELSNLNTSDVTNMSYMFYGCKSLKSLPNKWNTRNVTNMSYMFKGCSSLENLSGILEWNTENVTDMSFLFSECESLVSLSGLENFNTSNVINMSNLFNNCKSLTSLFDFSSWNTNNVKNMSKMFNNCKSLRNMSEISNLNINNVNNISYMFSGCFYLESLPDISNWNTKNITDISHMFSGCINLKSLPDISKWNTKNITDMSYLFNGCKYLKSLPDISEWDTDNVKNISHMFCRCISLKYLPNISIWNTNNLTNLDGMFDFCESLENLPDLTRWNINISNFIIKKKINIIVKTLTGQNITLSVYPTDTIFEVKCIIQDKIGMPPDQPILIYGNRPLKDHYTLDDLRIKEGAHISMVLRLRGCKPLPIYVKYYLGKFEIQACPNCTNIQQVKELIKKKVDFEPEYQEISFNGKSLDKETGKLASFGIMINSILDLNVPSFYYGEINNNYLRQIQILHEMGFYRNDINYKLLNQCLGDIVYYFENHYEFNK